MTKKSDGSSHICEICLKSCDDAKKNVKKLESRLQTLTIVCTASITLLGEHGVKALFDVLSNFNKSQEIASGKENSKQEGTKDGTKDNQKDKPIQGGKISFRPWRDHNYPNNQGNQKSPDAHEIADALAKLKQKPKEKQEELQVTGNPNLTKQIVKAATSTNTDLIASVQPFSVPADPYAAFLTPSGMPFDVYSTTLGLGINYGFGEYYGMDTSGYSTPTPAANTISVFVLGSLFNTRKRI